MNTIIRINRETENNSVYILDLSVSISVKDTEYRTEEMIKAFVGQLNIDCPDIEEVETRVVGNIVLFSIAIVDDVSLVVKVKPQENNVFSCVYVMYTEEKKMAAYELLRE